MKSEYKIANPSDFRAVIIDILDWFKKTKQETLVIALHGDLGAGKTTFTQELGKEFLIAESITSPTFTIMKQYELNHESFNNLVHIDAYRIENKEEVGPLRLNEVFQKPRTLVCVEWPEQIPSAVPKTAVLVDIKIAENDVRNVTTHFPSEK